MERGAGSELSHAPRPPSAGSPALCFSALPAPALPALPTRSALFGELAKDGLKAVGAVDEDLRSNWAALASRTAEVAGMVDVPDPNLASERRGFVLEPPRPEGQGQGDDDDDGPPSEEESDERVGAVAPAGAPQVGGDPTDL